MEQEWVGSFVVVLVPQGKKQECLFFLFHHLQDLTIPFPVYLSDFFLKGLWNRILFHFPFQIHGTNLSQTLKLLFFQMVSQPFILLFLYLFLCLFLFLYIKSHHTWGVEPIISLSPHRCNL